MLYRFFFLPSIYPSDDIHTRVNYKYVMTYCGKFPLVEWLPVCSYTPIQRYVHFTVDSFLLGTALSF